MEKRVLVALAEGCEEIEAVTVIDILRRAGISVTAAGLADGPVCAARGVQLLPDAIWECGSARECDMLVLPGGAGGARRLAEDERVLAALRTVYDRGGWVAAICAGPLALSAAGLLRGRMATCYPGLENRLDAGRMVAADVVVDERVITGRGPAAAMAFALVLVSVLLDESVARKLADDLLCAFTPPATP